MEGSAGMTGRAPVELSAVGPHLFGFSVCASCEVSSPSGLGPFAKSPPPPEKKRRLDPPVSDLDIPTTRDGSDSSRYTYVL